jgi:hypothetical protein
LQNLHLTAAWRICSPQNRHGFVPFSEGSTSHLTSQAYLPSRIRHPIAGANHTRGHEISGQRASARDRYPDRPIGGAIVRLALSSPGALEPIAEQQSDPDGSFDFGVRPPRRSRSARRPRASRRARWSSRWQTRRLRRPTRPAAWHLPVPAVGQRARRVRRWHRPGRAG